MSNSKGLLGNLMRKYEAEMIVSTLKTTKGNCTTTAKVLGLTRKHLYLKCKKYAIDYRNYLNNNGVDDTRNYVGA
jgi:DNA-binding NtrC family response regulator